MEIEIIDSNEEEVEIISSKKINKNKKKLSENSILTLSKKNIEDSNSDQNNSIIVKDVKNNRKFDKNLFVVEKSYTDENEENSVQIDLTKSNLKNKDNKDIEAQNHGKFIEEKDNLICENEILVKEFEKILCKVYQIENKEIYDYFSKKKLDLINIKNVFTKGLSK